MRAHSTLLTSPMHTATSIIRYILGGKSSPGGVCSLQKINVPIEDRKTRLVFFFSESTVKGIFHESRRKVDRRDVRPWRFF